MHQMGIYYCYYYYQYYYCYYHYYYYDYYYGDDDDNEDDYVLGESKNPSKEQSTAETKANTKCITTSTTSTQHAGRPAEYDHVIAISCVTPDRERERESFLMVQPANDRGTNLPLPSVFHCCLRSQEFLMGCLRLRGSARSMDVAKLMYDQVMVFELLGISGDAVPKETVDSFV